MINPVADRLRQLEDAWPELPGIFVLWRVADDWPVEYISATIARLGYRPELFLSGAISWCGLVHPEDRSRILAECADFMAEGRDRFTQRYRLIAADGTIRHMEDTTCVIRNAEGRITHLQGFLLDFTDQQAERDRLDAQIQRRADAIEEQRVWLEREIMERRRAEQALRESEARLEIAVRSAQITLFTLDTGLRYTWVFNPPPGIEIAAMIGRTDEEIFGEEGRSLALFKKRALEQNTSAQEEIAVTIQGVRRHFRISVDPMQGRNGHAMGLICAAFEITHQKQVEAALHDSEARYRAIVEAFDGFIYICGPDFTIEFMNKRLIERTGRSAIGEKCYKVLHGLDAPCPWCQAGRVFNGEPIRWEIQSPLDNRWYYVVNTPIPRADGTFAKMAAILDITERKAAEDQHEVSERHSHTARHLANIARLTGQVAHHFNNQLTVILGNAELALDECRDNGLLTFYLNEIRSASERAARLSNEMLISSGQAFTRIESYSLNELIDNARATIEDGIRSHIRIRYSLADALPNLKLDPSLIRQALLNLVANAVEAIGDQPGEVEIATGIEQLAGTKLNALMPVVQRTSGAFAFLRVTDSGGGLSPDVEPRLFDPYTSTKGIGRGMGLPVALGIASAHHGGLVFESRPGKGCTATLYLPLTDG